MADECEHGEPLGPAFACPPCQATYAPAPRRHAHLSNPFPARFPGRCPVCDEPIVEGDLIRMWDEIAVHDDCVTAP